MSDDREALRLIDDLLARPAGERSGFLDAACSDRPSLRRCVDAMLQAIDHATGMLPDTPEGLAPEPTTVTMNRSPVPPRAPKPIGLSLAVGEQLAGRYQIVRVVGVGGMGEVYQATDMVLGRDVAIKVIRGLHSRGGAMTERFERELKWVALLSHPNVVTLYDVAGEGHHRFAVMEYVTGQTLRKRMSAAIDWHGLVQISYGIASGLNAAHACGILHRDIKPENIMLGESGHAKILDFGIARPVAGSDGSPDAGIDDRGAGTIPYMSPEQVERRPLTFATDIFSFGVVLLEALSGRHPFRAESADQTKRNILETSPGLAAAIPDNSPQPLRSLIGAMLSAQPSDRPTVAQVIHAFRGLMGLTSSTTTVTSDSDLPSQATHPLPNDQRPTALPGGPPKIAVLPFDTLSADPAHRYFGDAVAQDMIAGLSRLRWLPVIARGSSFRFRGSDIDLATTARSLGADYLLTGTLQVDASRAVLAVELCAAPEMRVVWADRFEQALQDIMQYRFDVPLQILGSIEAGVQRAEDLRSASIPGDSLDAWSAYHRGLSRMFQFRARDNEQAAQLFQQALKQDPSFARAHAGLSFTHFQNAFLSMAGDFDEQCALAKQTAERAAEIDPLDPFISLTLGRSGWLAGDLESAGAWLNQSLQINPSYAFARYNRALIDVMMSDAVSSEQNIDQALRLSPIDPLAYAMHATQAMSCMLREDYEAAASCAEKAVCDPIAHVHIFATATIAHQLAGNHSRARELAGLILQKRPGYSPHDYFRSFPYRGSAPARRMRDALSQLIR